MYHAATQTPEPRTQTALPDAAFRGSRTTNPLPADAATIPANARSAFTSCPLAIQSGVRGHPPVVVRSTPRRPRRGYPRRSGARCPTPCANPHPAAAVTIPAAPLLSSACFPIGGSGASPGRCPFRSSTATPRSSPPMRPPSPPPPAAHFTCRPRRSAPNHQSSITSPGSRQSRQCPSLRLPA